MSEYLSSVNVSNYQHVFGQEGRQVIGEWVVPAAFPATMSPSLDHSESFPCRPRVFQRVLEEQDRAD